MGSFLFFMEFIFIKTKEIARDESEEEKKEIASAPAEMTLSREEMKSSPANRKPAGGVSLFGSLRVEPGAVKLRKTSPRSDISTSSEQKKETENNDQKTFSSSPPSLYYSLSLFFPFSFILLLVTSLLTFFSFSFLLILCGYSFIQLLEGLKVAISPKKTQSIQSDQTKVNQIFILIQSLLGTIHDIETQQRVAEMVKVLTTELNINIQKETNNDNKNENIEQEKSDIEKLKKQLEAQKIELEQRRIALEEVTICREYNIMTNSLL
jgi:hypothetical protein